MDARSVRLSRVVVPNAFDRRVHVGDSTSGRIRLISVLVRVAGPTSSKVLHVRYVVEGAFRPLNDFSAREGSPGSVASYLARRGRVPQVTPRTAVRSGGG